MQMRFRVVRILLALTSITYVGCSTAQKQEPSGRVYLHKSHQSRDNPSDSPPVVAAVVPASATLATVEELKTPSSLESSPTAIVEAVEASQNIIDEPTRLAMNYSSPSDLVDAKSLPISTESTAPTATAVTRSNAPVWPIDLAYALELTTGQNPQVAYARERIRESFARLQAANVLWLPSLRTGINYHKHDGRIQDVAGTIIETSRNSMYHGFGAQAVGAGSPAVPGVVMNFHMRDHLFQPKIAGQVLGATRQASQAMANDMLLETALVYCDLLEATQLRVIAEETRDHAQQLATVTQEFAKAGQGLPADADRSSAELAFRQVDVQRAIEQVRIRGVRLARQISHDPVVEIVPAEPFLAPIELVEASLDEASLVAQGLSMRPELTEHQYLVGEAIERLRRERFAPLVPSVLLGLSYGGNGGGLGSGFHNYGDRMDFDAAAFWEVRNLGYGEQAARCEMQSRVRQARLRQVQVLDRIASEVIEAKTSLVAKESQMTFAQSAIQAARESYRRNQERIANGQGLPIEALQAILALDQAQRLYATTVADYNRAQFRLHRALGFPVYEGNSGQF
jgi:outer membrane protein TolC